ncbi:PHP domain-containing protein [Chloroflexota bacterium]
MPAYCNRVDLHCHTTASDGELAPAELVSRAASLGIEVLAITDHDTTEGVPEALTAAACHGITVVPGVEISTLAGQEEIHLLGFFVDLRDADLQGLLARTRQARRERAREMLSRLANLGLRVEWEQLLECTRGGGSIGRPHVAAALLQAGLVGSWDEAFDLWIGRGRPAYVERYKLAPEDATQMVRNAGGLCVLAHPFVYNRYGDRKASLDLRRWLPRLREAGLEGIEVYYPNYPRRANRQLLAFAVKFGLLISGGSDFHGGMMAGRLGTVAVPWAAWEALERRCRVLQAGRTSRAHAETDLPAKHAPMQVLS